MPLSATASSTQSRPSATLRTRSLTSPAFVNLQALLRRLSSICLSRMESAVSAPRFSCASTTRRFWFFSASCPAVPIDAAQRLQRLFRAKACRVADHHLGQADDGVERGAQFVAHAREELRLVLARQLQLSVL